MVDVSKPALASRVLADLKSDTPGPSVVVVGGIHGNEPAGVLAAQAIAPELDALRSRLRGRVVLVAGNLGALAAGQRFIERDLNRGWTAKELRALEQRPVAELAAEDVEQRELAELIHTIERERRGPLAVFDLHTTSAPSAPFVCFGDTLSNRRLARALPTIAILGLEEVIEGAMAGYWTDRGHVSIALESGQHEDPGSVRRHVAAIWLLLTAFGALPRDAVPELDAHEATLQKASIGYPKVVEVRHRHVVAPDDAFVMAPGFASFDRVSERQIVAQDARGAVRCPRSGLMLMPRYQSQGEDGYFIVQEVRPFWLTLSDWMRRMGAPKLLPYLPGVRRDPARPGHVVIDPRIARSHVADLMHLCGYRRRRSPEQQPVFARRLGE